MRNSDSMKLHLLGEDKIRIQTGSKLFTGGKRAEEFSALQYILWEKTAITAFAAGWDCSRFREHSV